MWWPAPARRSTPRRCCNTAPRLSPLSKRRSGLCSQRSCRKPSAASSTARRWRKGGIKMKPAASSASREGGHIPFQPPSLPLRGGGSNRQPRRTLLPASCQRMHPALHALLGVGDVVLGEEILRPHLVDRLDRAEKVALVAERHGGIDAHAAFELGVRRCPLLLTRRHALSRHEGLAAAARNRIENVGAWIDAGGQAPHHVIHRIGIDVFADCDRKPHALRA